jgi:RHS repeat-associated protein
MELRSSQVRDLGALAAGVLLSLTATAARASILAPVPGAVTAQTVRLPDGPGSVHGLADPASIKVFSGQVGYSIPIALPAGRAGFGPSLALTYSGEFGNGPVGVGWTIGVMGIRRTLTEGVPRYTREDELELVGIGGGGRLYTSDGRRYWLEGAGTTVRVERFGDSFEVIDGNGLHYVLGATPGSREGKGDRTLTWLLESITDVTGQQRIDLTYEHDDAGGVCLSGMQWGPAVASTGVPAFRLVVELEKRPDRVTSWAAGYEVILKQRIKGFQVISFGETVRRYRLLYAPPSSAFRLSRLSEVQVTGLERANVPLLPLPPTSFKYEPPTAPSTKKVEGLDGWALNERETSLVDVDGDGMADLYRMEQGGHFYRKGTGSGYSEARYRVPGAEGYDLSSSRLMDLDGDARPDLVRIVNDTWRWSRLVATDPGNLKFRWETQGDWPGSAGVPLHGTDTVFADVNGDGRTDVIRAAAGAILVQLNGPQGLGPVQRRPQLSVTDAIVEPGNPGVQFEDFNGDHLVDVIQFTDEWMNIWLGRGDGTFVPWGRFDYPWPRGAFSEKDLLLADLDRDGFTDLIRVTAGYVAWFPGLAEGGFSKDWREAPRPVGAAFDAVVTTADANGNGSQDIIWSTASGMWVLDLAGHSSAGMMREIDNGLGMTTKVTYSASAVLSAADEIAGNPWLHKLPMSVPVPVQMETTFASGDPTRRVLYSIRDGVWDGAERRFAGFMGTETTNPGPSAGETYREETRYLPGLGADRVLRGVAWLVRKRDGAGQILSEEMTDWQTLPVSLLPDHPWAKKPARTGVTTRNFQGVTTPIETLSTFEYDGEVRPVLEHHQGVRGIPGDEQEIERTFGDDDLTWVRNRVCEEKVFEGDRSTLVSDTRTFYGDDTATVLQLCKVGRGWTRLTQGYFQAFSSTDPAYVASESSQWIDLTRRTYDGFGNVLTAYDGGVTRTLAYDENNLRTLSETIQPGNGKPALSWTAVWDPALEVVTSRTDPNQIVTREAYDGLARPISERLEVPGQGLYPPHTYFEHQWSGPRPTTTIYSFDGPIGPQTILNRTVLQNAPDPRGLTFAQMDPGWHKTVVVRNGAGEELCSATQMEANRWLVGAWKERDERGHVTVFTEPFYFSGSAPPTVRPQTGIEFQTIHYDALGRDDRHLMPNGSRKDVTFRAFELTTATSGLAPVTQKFDGLGRIIHSERRVNGLLEEADGTYDAAGRLVSIRLQGGQAEHVFRYDTLGRLRYANDPDIGKRLMRYNDRNWLVRSENGKGEVVGFQYDDVGRLLARGPGEVRQLSQDYVYHYDDADPTLPGPAYTAGQLGSVDEPQGEAPGAGKVRLAYDIFGRRRIVHRTIGTVVGWESVVLSPSGLVLEERAGDGMMVQPEYDRAGRTTKVGDIWRAGAAGVLGDSRDARGTLLSETYGNGLVQTYSRGPLGMLTGTELRDGADQSVLYSITVGTRTPFGAPESIIDNVPGGRDHTATFAYDKAARLTNATVGSGASAWQFRYRYDGLQNMTARFQNGPIKDGIGVISGYYRYGDKDGHPGPRQLRSITHVDCPGSETLFEYDGAGRLHKDGARTLIYDPHDQLTRVEQPEGTLLEKNAYGYDGLRTFTDRGGTDQQFWFSAAHTLKGNTRFHYLRVGERVVARLAFTNSNTATIPSAATLVSHTGVGSSLTGLMAGVASHVPGSPLQIYLLSLTAAFAALGIAHLRRGAPGRRASALTVSYVLMASLAGCADTREHQLAAESTGNRLYFHNGVAAGPVMITNANSTPGVVDERRFEPFGQPIDETPAMLAATDPLNILNKETDSKTGWSYHGARWMQPQTARWIAPDPLAKAPDERFMKDPWGLNPYQFVDQNPVVFWDPTGQYADRYDLQRFWCWLTGKTFKDPNKLEPGPNADWHEYIGTLPDGTPYKIYGWQQDLFSAAVNLQTMMEHRAVLNSSPFAAIANGITAWITGDEDKAMTVATITATVEGVLSVSYVTIPRLRSKFIQSADADVEHAVRFGSNKPGDIGNRANYRVGAVKKMIGEAPLGPNGGSMCTRGLPGCAGELFVSPKAGTSKGPLHPQWQHGHDPAWSTRFLPWDSTRAEWRDLFNEHLQLECTHCNQLDGRLMSR